MDISIIVRESFTLYYAGSEIFSMELDGLKDNKDVLMDKFMRDVQFLHRPSSPSLTGIHLKDSKVTAEMLKMMLEKLNEPGMHLKKAAVVGLNVFGRRMFSRHLKAITPPIHFVYSFFDDYEKAKEWLVL